MEQSRRVFIGHAVKGGLFVVSYTFWGPRFLYAAIDPTPEQTAGPFYRQGAPLKERLEEPGDPGTRLTVSGQVVDTNEHPLPDTKIEIWHANHHGQYDMDGYRYRAQLHMNNQGRYRFTTVLPGSYGERPRHIHYRISSPDHKPLITQLYFETDPYFEGNPDKNFRKDPLLRYRELIRPVSSTSDQLAVFFRICLEKS